MEDNHTRVIEEKWANVLAHIWIRTQWSRIRGRRPLDVFEHRLEYAKYEMDVPSVLQRLANSLSIQGIQVPVEDVEFLRKHEEEALDVLRRWTKLLALKASVKAKELRGRVSEQQQQAVENGNNSTAVEKEAGDNA